MQYITVLVYCCVVWCGVVWCGVVLCFVLFLVLYVPQYLCMGVYKSVCQLI